MRHEVCIGLLDYVLQRFGCGDGTVVLGPMGESEVGLVGSCDADRCTYHIAVATGDIERTRIGGRTRQIDRGIHRDIRNGWLTWRCGTVVEVGNQFDMVCRHRIGKLGGGRNDHIVLGPSHEHIFGVAAIGAQRDVRASSLRGGGADIECSCS